VTMDYVKRVVLSAALFSVALNPIFAVAEDEDSFRCDIGPVTKTYGQGQWLVYSCNDDKTVLIVCARQPGHAVLFHVPPYRYRPSLVRRRHRQQRSDRHRLRTTQIAVRRRHCECDQRDQRSEGAKAMTFGDLQRRSAASIARLCRTRHLFRSSSGSAQQLLACGRQRFPFQG
jgi:hypothetical protein